MQPVNQTEAIPQAVRDLVDLFNGALVDVHFPDVNRESLAALVEKVTGLVAEVAEAQAALLTAQKALEKSETALSQSHQQLIEMAKRGLAYARVFADGNDRLLEQLGAISLKSGKAQTATSKPRGRPRKNAETAETETAETETGEALAVEALAAEASSDTLTPKPKSGRAKQASQ